MDKLGRKFFLGKSALNSFSRLMAPGILAARLFLEMRSPLIALDRLASLTPFPVVLMLFRLCFDSVFIGKSHFRKLLALLPNHNYF